MNRIGIIITSLLICSTSYAGYVTIEKEKIAIGDNTKVVDKLPIGKRVEVISETNNRYIIKYDDKIAEINSECLQFPQNEQPSIFPYSGYLQKVYEISLELNKGEEYKVIKEDKTKYLVAYQLKKTVVEIWIEKDFVSYKEFSKLEEEQIAKGLLVKYQDKWVTPDEKYELEQKAKGLIKYEGKWLTYEQIQEAKGLVKYQDNWVTPYEKFELEQKLKGLTKYKGEWLAASQLREEQVREILEITSQGVKIEIAGEWISFKDLESLGVYDLLDLPNIEEKIRTDFDKFKDETFFFTEYINYIENAETYIKKDLCTAMFTSALLYMALKKYDSSMLRYERMKYRSIVKKTKKLYRLLVDKIDTDELMAEKFDNIILPEELIDWLNEARGKRLFIE